MATLLEFERFIKNLKIVLPKFAPDFSEPIAVALWYDMFKNYTIEDYRKVYTSCRDSLAEFPCSVSFLKDQFDKVLNTEPPRDIFKDLIRFIAGGSRGSIDFILARIVEHFGGSQIIGLWEEKDYPWRKKEVEAAYKELINLKKAGVIKPHQLELEGVKINHLLPETIEKPKLKEPESKIMDNKFFFEQLRKAMRGEKTEV